MQAIFQYKPHAVLSMQVFMYFDSDYFCNSNQPRDLERGYNAVENILFYGDGTDVESRN